MTTLATDKPRTYELGDLNSLPMVATDIIYEGAAVGLSSGNARPLTAGDPFQGFCIENSDNSTGSAGDKRVKLKTHGEIQLAIGSLAATDVDKPVYASDDDTFTLTATSNSYVGKVKRFVSSGVGIVAFDVRRGGSATPLTDNSTGTASDTIAAITDAATKNAIASLAAKVNAIIAMNQ